MQIKNALISSFTKDQALVDFVIKLAESEIQIYASGGTATFLTGYGVKLVDLTTIVGKPKFDHRIVTISQPVFGSILADKAKPKHMEELAEMGMVPMDLLYVNPYPTAEAFADKDKTENEKFELIDIGGPAMLMAGVKNQLVVGSKPEHFNQLLQIVKMAQDGTIITEPDYQEMANYLLQILIRLLYKSVITHLINEYYAVFNFLNEGTKKLFQE
ncbi:MAG: hypothetical protein WC621_03720 [Patescibacteria group bacterium]